MMFDIFRKPNACWSWACVKETVSGMDGTGLSVGDFVHTLGDAHLYSNHFEQSKLQLSRSSKKLPKLKISKRRSDINQFRFEDFEIEDYEPYPNIPAPVAV